MSKIFVTRPSLPDIEEVKNKLHEIWQSRNLTNNGQFHQELEERLADFLGVKYVSLFANGTLALITALKLYNIKGEVITTPFTFVATTHSLLWNNIKPVFCDIRKDNCNIDESSIEALVKPGITSAIMPVHVYGSPCDTEKIQSIADQYGLKVIYDAAHAFNVRKNDESILNFGDLSVLSFHATKIFNTFEGGAIICHDEETKKKIDQLKNFGFTGEISVDQIGLNSKMNEFQSVIGLLQLDQIEELIEKNKQITKSYMEQLKGIKGIRFLEHDPSVQYNYSYFPVFIEKEYKTSRDELYELMLKHDIYARRYFYPLITDFEPYRAGYSSENLLRAKVIANEVLCLPIFPSMTEKEQRKIINLIK